MKSMPKNAAQKPRIVLPESPINMLAGGKLNTRKPKHTPNRHHAVVNPRPLVPEPEPYARMYVAAITAPTPAESPSEPSRKLNEFTKSTTVKQIAATPSHAGATNGNRHRAAHSVMPATTCAASLRNGDRPRASSRNPASQTTPNAKSHKPKCWRNP